MTTPITFGRTRLRPTSVLKVSFDGVGPAALPVTENIATFTLLPFHVVHGIPVDGAGEDVLDEGDGYLPGIP